MTQQFKTIHYLFISRGNQICWSQDIVYCIEYIDHQDPGRRQKEIILNTPCSGRLPFHSLSRSITAGQDGVEVEVLDDERSAGVDGDLGRT